ncbi:hypothetical protein Tco_1276279 [Tanacetum coccineum]
MLICTSTWRENGGVRNPPRPPPTHSVAAGLHHQPRKRKAKAQFGRRESRQEDPGKDPEPSPYSTQWGNYFGEMIRSIPLYHPSWQKVPAGDKARLMATLGSTYNLEPHMRSERWPRIEGYIQAQFGKSYNTNKATLKREHWIRDPETRAYDLDRIRRGKPDEYTDMMGKYINIWNRPCQRQRRNK